MTDRDPRDVMDEYLASLPDNERWSATVELMINRQNFIWVENGD